MMADFQSFREALEDIHTTNHESEVRNRLPALITSLGYSDENIFYEDSIEPSNQGSHRYRVDAVVKKEVTAPVWMAIEVDFDHQVRTIQKEEGDTFGADGLILCEQGISEFPSERPRKLCSAANSYQSLIISNASIELFDGDAALGKPLMSIHPEEIEVIFESLSAPSVLPDESNEKTVFNKWHSKKDSSDVDVAINTDYFDLQLHELWEHLDALESAKGSHEKGVVLEELGELLFDSITVLEIQSTRFRSTASEIDIIAEYDIDASGTVFDEYGRYIIIECKNWSDSVGADEIRNLKGKMDTANVSLGILIAPEGVSGESGKDAVDQINQIYQQSQQVIIVLDRSDIESLFSGTSLYDLIDDKIFNRRFRKLV